MSSDVLTPSSAVQRLRTLVPSLRKGKTLESAMRYAERIYGDRTLKPISHLTLFEHAVRSAEFLAEFCHDESAIVACILQYALRIDGVTLQDLSHEFGKDVRDIVSRVHLLSHLYTADWRKSVEDLRIMLVSVSDDVRILLIALSDACTFLQQFDSIESAYRMRLCRQALQLFAPVAARLGIYALKYRLERTAFPECYPSDAQNINRQLATIHTDHGSFLQQTSSAIRTFLNEQGIEADVMAREKQPYSIFQKMQTKSVTSLEKITDLFAIRVIVPKTQDCYQTLGLIHRLGTPISHRFKDYISFPKPNGYQSLHTCLIGLPHAPKDAMVEVQIRTHDMHQEAEYGIAAHWLYKHIGKKNSGGLHQSLALQELSRRPNASDSQDALSQHSVVDHIYVLTPRGDIVELPNGGTPLDFAFHVHTDLGLKFKSARVNGSIVPISYELENGDIVEVQTHKEPRPALQWLEQLVTASARSKLKAYFFAHNRSQFLARGRDIVNTELRQRRLPRLDADLSQLASFDGQALSTREREDLLVKAGMGSVRTSSILRHLALPELPPKVQSAKKKKTSSAVVPPGTEVAIDGSPLTLPHRFAKCCSPDAKKHASETLIGVVTRSAVITVHRESCKMVKGGNPERRLKMYWV